MQRYEEGDDLPDESEAYDMGFQSAADGLTDADNPFPVSTNQHLSWNDGHMRYHDEQDQIQHEVASAERAQMNRSVPAEVTDQLAGLRALTMAQIAEKMDFPLEEWPGNCFGVASKLVEAFGLQNAVAVYGHYRGPISARCRFFHGKPVVHHGWVLLDEKIVLDPTRWVFEAKIPYLAVFEPWNDEHAPVFDQTEYDEGGEVFNDRLRGPRPLPCADDRMVELDGGDKSLLGVLMGLLGPLRDKSRLTLDEVRWAAKTPYSKLGTPAATVFYPWLATKGLKALIPIDYLNRARRNGVAVS